MSSETGCCCRGSKNKSCPTRNIDQCNEALPEENICSEGDKEALDDFEQFCKFLEEGGALEKKKKKSCGCKKRIDFKPTCNNRNCSAACEDEREGGCNDDSCEVTQEVLRKLGIILNNDGNDGNDGNDDNDDPSPGNGGGNEGCKPGRANQQGTCGQTAKCGNKRANIPKGEGCKSYVKDSECTRHASPIDIDDSSAQSGDYPPLEWSKNCPFVSNTTLTCTDKTVKLTIDNPTEFNISGGPLKGCYKMDEVHFHWGEDDDDGSEHTFGGKHYAMEMHVVYHLKRGDEFGAPKKLVLGYVFQISDECNSVMDTITEAILESLQMFNATIRVPNFVLRGLIRKDTTNYYTYTGSLTTPPFSQPVLWIIFMQPHIISSSQLNTFREIIPCNRMNIFPDGPTNVYRSGSAGEAPAAPDEPAEE